MAQVLEEKKICVIFSKFSILDILNLILSLGLKTMIFESTFGSGKKLFFDILNESITSNLKLDKIVIRPNLFVFDLAKILSATSL